MLCSRDRFNGGLDNRQKTHRDLLRYEGNNIVLRYFSATETTGLILKDVADMDYQWSIYKFNKLIFYVNLLKNFTRYLVMSS